jgi:hypothetical protein
MTTLANLTYAFDPTGQLSANRITGELQALTGAGAAYTFVIPRLAPFFGESISLSFKDLQGNIRPMVLGVDYYLSHTFIGASRACSKPVYGSITILNTELVGTLIFAPYQIVGGEWALDAATITAILADQIHNPRTTSWDMVAGYPSIFPPTPHAWNLQDMVGMSAIVAALNQITDAILTQASSTLTTHVNDHNNPHGVTADQIGAMTSGQVAMAIQSALVGVASNTDKVPEGDVNKYFTEARVLATRLANLQTLTAQNLAEGDTVLTALEKLQGQCQALLDALGKKANSARPAFSGLGSQNTVAIDMTTTLAIDISLSEAFIVNIKGNGAIGFNTNSVGDMTGRLVEFAVTTVNDNSGNSYAIAWPSNVKWVDGAPPPRSTAAGAKDIWYFVSDDNMVTWTGSLSNANPR